MRTPSELDRLNQITCSALIDTAAERGVIDGEQREQLHRLALELAASAPNANAVAQGTVAPSGADVREARRDFNAITVAYSLGALLVLFALGWLLADRWSAFGPGGVLGVSALYAAAFAGVAMALRRRGFALAGGISAALAVAMTPVWGWAVLRLTGEWPDPLAWDNALARYEPYIASRVIIVELATIGIGLATLRRVRFFAVAAPIAVAFVGVMVHLGVALGDPRLSWYVGPYYQCVIACTAFAVAYAIDRRQPKGEDYALWFYLAGAVTLAFGYTQVWSSIGAWRHALPLVAASLVIAALYLRRRVLLLAGGVAAFGYLGYLAFDVFRKVIAMPVALAALGLLVIVTTVWMQRRFPKLVQQVTRADEPGAKALPAGPVAVLGPLLIAITAMAFAFGEAKERTDEQDWQGSLWRLRMKQQARVAKRAAASDSTRAGTPDSTGAPSRPRPEKD